jgi:hypothetical protein
VGEKAEQVDGHWSGTVEQSNKSDVIGQIHTSISTLLLPRVSVMNARTTRVCQCGGQTTMSHHGTKKEKNLMEMNSNKWLVLWNFLGFFFFFLLLFWVGLRLGLNSTCEVKLNTIVFIETNYTTAAWCFNLCIKKIQSCVCFLKWWNSCNCNVKITTRFD